MVLDEQTKVNNVLVVDDQEAVRKSLGGILARKGYAVTTAADGYEALEAVKKTKFQVVFMDIKMPGINGVETFIKMKGISPGISVIMMTAFTLENEVTQAVQEGAYAIINKPFDMERIFQILEECLGSRPLVLIVDDRVDDRKIMQSILESKGFKVECAQTGEECLDLVKSKKYQIVLLDLKLPGINGIETLKELKEIRPEVAVIVVSGYSADELMEEAVKQGSFCTIRKPVDMDKLLGAIDQCLQSK